ncbi:MAG: hypothetical protein KAR19_02435 [Bacteroidales bacterium]|nr:hypothetical protein [Bacteroidales bacterium]
MKINVLCTGYCACRKGIVQGVSERLVSKGGAFYSLLAQEGQSLVFRRLFLFGWWDLLSTFVVNIYCFVIILQQDVKEQMKWGYKNHDGKTSMCDTPGWPLVLFYGKQAFPHAPLQKPLAA